MACLGADRTRRTGDLVKGIVLAGGRATRLEPGQPGDVEAADARLRQAARLLPDLHAAARAASTRSSIISTPSSCRCSRRCSATGRSGAARSATPRSPSPNGIAAAFLIGEEFIGDDDVALILGDNIFYGVGLGEQLQQYTEPEGRGGVRPVGARPGALRRARARTPTARWSAVHEKPADPPSNYMVPGLYFYDNSVVEVAGSIEPSARGELEISEVNNHYLREGRLEVSKLPFSTEWFDVGTFDALLDAQTWVAGQQRRKGLLIGSPETAAHREGFITADQLRDAGRRRRPGRRPRQERLRRAPAALPRVRGGAEPMAEIVDFDARAHRDRRAARSSR